MSKGAGFITNENFDKRAYGAAGFGQADVDELLRRGHSYNEINDYVQGQKASLGAQFGTGAEAWLRSEGRKQEEAKQKRAESKARAYNYISENKREQQDHKQDFTGGQVEQMASKFGGEGSKYKPEGGYMNKQYDFSYKR